MRNQEYWCPARGGFNRVKFDEHLGRLSAMDLRVVLRVLEIIGKMSVNMAAKRSLDHGEMEREDISVTTLDALMDIHAHNHDTALPLRTLRSWIPPRPVHGPPEAANSDEVGGLSSVLPSPGLLREGGGAPSSIGGARPSAPDDRVGGSAVRGCAHVTPARAGDTSAPVVDSRTGRVAGSLMGSPEE